jgi:hypothetical protein
MFMMLLAIGTRTVFMQAQENQPLLVMINLEVYPKEIYYGDIFFNRVIVQNNMEKITWFTIHKGDYMIGGTNVLLKQNDVQVYRWLPHAQLNFLERPIASSELYWRTSHGLCPRYEISAHATERVFLRPLWFPMPEYSDSKATQELEATVLSGKQQYEVGVCDDSEPFWKPKVARYTCPITVKPRPKEDYELILEWYYELPTTRADEMWTEDAVFAHPFYIRESPWNTRVYYRGDKDAKEKLAAIQTTDDEIASWKTYNEFSELFLFRTPEVLARIDRTNELAAKIIERSKDPDSTFSQNMVEFIQLRGFLVDMRYAENSEAEEVAFVKMMDFVDQSQDKELWIDFLYDVGLGSIENHTHFPYAKVFEYRRRFAERMQIKNLCRSFEDYDRIYGFPEK